MPRLKALINIMIPLNIERKIKEINIFLTIASPIKATIFVARKYTYM